MKWEKTTLKKVTEYITDGDHQPAPKADKGISFIKIKDIDNNRISFSNSLFVPQEYYDKLPQNRKAVYGDVLYTVVGSYGIPVLVDFRKDFCFERNIALLHPNNTIEPSFLYYSMKNPVFFEQANNIANGSAQKLIPLSKLASMEISIPPLETQRRIASILSAYDDLIENNQKQIKLLEEAAQRLYKEWFVDLRFPNYENTPVVDGVPEGWRKDLLGNCMIIKRGGSPRPIQSYLVDNGLNWLKISDVTSAIGYYITDIKEHIKSEGLRKTVLLKKGSLVLSNSATPGIPRILDVDSCIHDGWLYFEESIFTNEYLLLMFNEERKKIISLGTGAIFTNLKTDIIKNYPHIIPPKDVLEQFQSIINPLFSKIKTIQRSIKSLTEARDRLLPKLMSGELEV